MPESKKADDNPRLLADTPRLKSPEELPDVLKRERVRRKDDLTWKDLARATGVAYQSLQDFEARKAKLSLGPLRRWCRALGLPEDWADRWRQWAKEREIEGIIGRNMDEEMRKAILLLVHKSWREEAED